VAIDGAVVDIHLIVVGGVHQSIAAFNYAGALGERLKNEKFGYGQGDRLAVPGAGMTVGIHDELAALDRLVHFDDGNRAVLRHHAA
jgi:hypothetical protein